MGVASCQLYTFTFGDLGGIQTHDLQNRNLTLYSAKLRDLPSIIMSMYLICAALPCGGGFCHCPTLPRTALHFSSALAQQSL